MRKYYVFLNNQFKTFCKVDSLRQALVFSNKDETFVFKRVDGVPNPWFLHPVRNGKVLKDIILRGDEHKYFTTPEEWAIQKEIKKNKVVVQKKMNAIFNELLK